MTEKTASQRGKSANVKGKLFQSSVAKAIRPWFPEAISGRDNGYRTRDFTAPDTGDLARAGANLFWSLKNVEAALTMPPGMIMGWMQEATEKGLGRIPLVVVKRKGHANPLRSWCWVWLPDLAHLLGSGAAFLDEDTDRYPMMMELGFVLDLLARAGHTDLCPGMEAVVA